MRSGVAVSPSRNGATARSCRERVGRAGQVVTLVEHHQPELVAEVLHVQVRRVVRRDRERSHVVLAAAHDADLRPNVVAQQVVPLAHEIEVGASTSVLRRRSSIARQRHLGLSRAGGEHHHAAVLVGLPGGERLGLIGPRLAPDARALGQLAVPAGPILDELTLFR